MKPRILVALPGQGRPENYTEAVAAAGGEPTGIYAPEVDLSYDGLIICGGPDVEPALYGQENRGSVGMEPARDRAEMPLAKAYVKAGKPVFGICRGLQLLNVFFGGDLIQHLDTTSIHSSGGHGDLVHETMAAEGSILHDLFGKYFATNSSHHQAIDRLAPGLIATQWSENGKVIEAFEHKNLPVFAVQWHPERMCCSHRREDTPDALVIFQRFLQICQKYRG